MPPPPDPLSASLAALIAGAVRAEVEPAVEAAVIRALPAVVRRAAIPPFLTKAELAELTGWSPRKIDYLRERGRLPYTKVGRSVRFRTVDVEHLIDEARVEARSKALTNGRGQS